jgi:phosphatidylserine/phosphatidylglycerophosphate/cardiolipin synthase-like enzyme
MVRVGELPARTFSDVQSDPDSRSAGSHATVGRASNLVALAAAAAPPVVTRTVDCYNLPHFASSAVLQLAFKSDVEELVGNVIPYCQKYLWIACYVYEGFYNIAIEQRARAGVACKMVCDRNKLFQVGSGLRMQQAMLCLLEWGVEIRHNLPGQGNIMSAQHQKTWLVDGGLLLYGSHNLSKNSARNADELLCATSVKSACDGFANHFEWLWDRSIAVEARELQELIDKHLANKEVKAEERTLARQRSQSLMRGGD